MNGSYLAYLQAELNGMESLRALLAEEREAMEQQQFTDLPTIGVRKEQVLRCLTVFEERREAAQRAAGLAAGRAGADAAALAGGEPTRKAWSELLAVTARARAENMRNGAIIGAHMEFTQRALNILRTSAQVLYGPDGIHRARSMRSSTRLAAG